MAFSRTHSLLARAGSTSTYKRVWRYWYPLMTRGLGNDEIVFINWAYEEDPPMDLPLEASDEPNRAHINLYHRTATQVDLGDKQVLEVSCGHGGGASYLTRTLHPASYTGLDLNQAGIKLCKKRHRLPGLDFVRGDAENLPFDDESFDVVLNVEASHCYPHFRRFLAEVVRVLRPGGYFPYADLRPTMRSPHGRPTSLLPRCGNCRSGKSTPKCCAASETIHRSHGTWSTAICRPSCVSRAANSSVCRARSCPATWKAGNSRTGCTASPRTEPVSGNVARMSPAEREFDIVLYGATGFSGKLTAEHLAHSGSTARIALAGRSSERLRGVRMMLGPNAADWPLILADASQPLTLEAMAARAQVVLTTVGPYTRYGLPLVAACAKAGTDYADLTGELMFCRNSIDLYHKQAADTGARIILACGFDSIPSDLNVYQLYRRSVEDGTGELCDTDLVLRSFSQRWVSGGSVATYSEAMRTASSDPEARRLVTDPYTLTTDRGAEPELGAQPDFLRRPGRDLAPELAGFWTGGFVQAPFNTRIVRRSNALQEWAYGRRFRYSETMSLGKSMAAPILAAAVTGTIGLGNKYFDRLPRRLVERVTPKPGTGPSRKTQERGHYTFETYTTTTTGARYRATFAHNVDAYKSTAVLLAQSGLALALDRDRLAELRGVLTPAAAMGDALLARLPGAGVVMGTTRLS